MNYHHFTIEERCCLREYYVKGRNRKAFGQKCQFGISGTEAELYLFQRYTQILSVYGAKEKQLAQQLPPPRNVLGTGSVGLHRRKVIPNVVARTDIQYSVRNEDAVV